MVAAIEYPAFFRFLLDHPAAALGTLGAGFFHKLFNVFALGISWAGDKLAIPAHLNHHLTAAFFADQIGFILLQGDLDILHLFLGLLESLVKVSVKLLQGVYPIFLARLNAIQILFHLCGKFHIDDFRETLLHQLSSNLSQLRRL